MRLFVALDIPPAIRTALEQYVDEMRRTAPDLKWVRPESYHVTVKFIGEWKRDVREMLTALEKVKASAVHIEFRNSGFFPNANAPRVFWAGIEADDKLAALAKQVEEACAVVGIKREDHEFNPHLTLARSGSGSPRPKRDENASPNMKRFAERIAAIPAPEFGSMRATEFYLYESKLSAGGAAYAKLKAFALS